MSDWEKAVLGDHASVKARLGWKGLKADEYLPDGFIFLATPNLKGGRIDFYNVNFIAEWRYDESPEIKLEVGDVLLTKDGSTLGISAYVRHLPKPATVNGSIAVIRCGETLCSEYLFYVINGQKFQRLIQLKKGGLGVPHLFQADLRKFPVPLPDLPTQRRIAAVLRTVDEVIEATEARIEKQQAIKQGLLHDLFIRGVTPDGQLRPPPTERPDFYQETELGLIPKEWEVQPVGVIGSVKGGKRLPLGTNFADRPTRHPYLRVTDMKDWGIDDSNLEFVEDRVSAMISRYTISSNDLYITIAGTLGLVGRVPEHLSGAQLTENAAKITDLNLDEFNSEYLCAFLNCDAFKKQIQAEIGTGGGVPKLAIFRIAAMGVALPDFREQSVIASTINSSVTGTTTLRACLDKLRQLKSALMQDLLTGRVPADAIDLDILTKEA